jgi:hypothetical protein
MQSILAIGQYEAGDWAGLAERSAIASGRSVETGGGACRHAARQFELLRRRRYVD